MKRVKVKITESSDWEYIKLANFFMPDKFDVLPDDRPFVAMQMTDGRIYDKQVEKWFTEETYKPDIKDNVVVEITDPTLTTLPYADETAILVKADYVLHKVRDIYGLMSEIARVLKPGYTADIRVPCFPHMDAVSDPATVRFFTPETFKYFSYKFKYITQRMEGSTLAVKLRK